MNEKIKVEHLLVTVRRIEQWLEVLRKGLEALPQDQELELDLEDFEKGLESRGPWKTSNC